MIRPFTTTLQETWMRAHEDVGGVVFECQKGQQVGTLNHIPPSLIWRVAVPGMLQLDLPTEFRLRNEPNGWTLGRFMTETQTKNGTCCCPQQKCLHSDVIVPAFWYWNVFLSHTSVILHKYTYRNLDIDFTTYIESYMYYFYLYKSIL